MNRKWINVATRLRPEEAQRVDHFARFLSLSRAEYVNLALSVADLIVTRTALEEQRRTGTLDTKGAAVLEHAEAEMEAVVQRLRPPALNVPDT